MRRLLYWDVGCPCRSFGLLVLRAVVGAAFMFHGWSKVQTATSWMRDTTPAAVQALVAYGEFLGGAALILGFLTPLAAIGLGIIMAGAIFKVHVPAGHAFVAGGPGQPSYELAAAYLAAVIALLTTGPGWFSLDKLLFGRTQAPDMLIADVAPPPKRI